MSVCRWFLVGSGFAYRLSFEGPLSLFYPVCLAIKSSVSNTQDVAIWAPLEYRSCTGSNTHPIRAAWKDRVASQQHGSYLHENMTIWDRLTQSQELPEEDHNQRGFFEQLPRWQFGGKPIWVLDGNCATKEFEILLEGRGRTPAVIFDGVPDLATQGQEKRKSIKWIKGEERAEQALASTNTFIDLREHTQSLPRSFYTQECQRLQEIKNLFVYTMEEKYNPPIRPVCIDSIVQLPASIAIHLTYVSFFFFGAWAATAYGWNRYQRALPPDVIMRASDDIPIRAMMDCAAQTKAFSFLTSTAIFYFSYLSIDGGGLLLFAFAQVTSNVLWVSATLLALMCLARGWGISRSALTEGELGNTMIFVLLGFGLISVSVPSLEVLIGLLIYKFIYYSVCMTCCRRCLKFVHLRLGYLADTPTQSLPRLSRLSRKLHSERQQFRMLFTVSLWTLASEIAVFYLFVYERSTSESWFAKSLKARELSPTVIASIISWLNELLLMLVILTVLSWQDGFGASIRSWDIAEFTNRANAKVPFWHIDKSHLWSASEMALKKHKTGFPEAVLLINPTFNDWDLTPGSLDKNLEVASLHTYSRGLLLGLADHQSHIAEWIRQKRSCTEDQHFWLHWFRSLKVMVSRCNDYVIDLCTNRAPPADTWEESGRYDNEMVIRYHRLPTGLTASAI